MKDINLYERYVESMTKRRNTKKTFFMILPILVLVLVLAGVFTWQYVKLQNVRQENKELKSFVNDASNKELLKQSEGYDKKNAAIDVAVEQLSYFRALYEKFPVFPKILFQTVSQLATQYGITIESWEYAKGNGAIQISAITSNNEQISEFIKKLRDSKEFIAVRYEGYLQKEDINSATINPVNVSFSAALVVNPLTVSETKVKADEEATGEASEAGEEDESGE